jgi:hypothetical protein
MITSVPTVKIRWRLNRHIKRISQSSDRTRKEETVK